MSSFDTARDIRMPGVVIENVYFDPTRISTRMKNAVKKMLREGCAHGGWNSKSKQIAVKLAEACGVRLATSSGWGFTAPPRNTYGTKHVEEILALIDAEEALELMQDAQDYAEPHRTRVQERTRDKHNRNRAIIRGDWPNSRWIQPSSNKEFQAQMIEVFLRDREPAVLEKAEKLCDMIDRGERIAITIEM